MVMMLPGERVATSVEALALTVLWLGVRGQCLNRDLSHAGRGHGVLGP